MINQDIKASIPGEEAGAEFVPQILIGYSGKMRSNRLKVETAVKGVEFTWLKAFSIGLSPLHA